jgi:hypothetical protein
MRRLGLVRQQIFMVKRLFVASSLLLLLGGCAVQSASVSEHGFYIPQNLTEANAQLDKVLTPKARTKFSGLPDSSLQYVNLELLSEWDHDSSRLTRYLNRYVQPQYQQWPYFDWQVRQHLILLSYLRYLQQRPFDVAVEAHRVYAEADSATQRAARIRLVHLVADSIDGIYIPRNLRESFTQLDRLLPDTIKQRLRHPDSRYGLADFHMGLGLWMRNNWQLWGGSRLQQYLQALGVEHPDNMSGVILTTYSDYLNGQPLDEQALRAAYAPAVATSQPVARVDSLAVVATQRPATSRPRRHKRREYTEEYRRFLRRRRIADFDELPPGAYGIPGAAD